jgi:hypothetical protein
VVQDPGEDINSALNKAMDVVFFVMGIQSCGWMGGRGVGNWWENALEGIRLACC